MPLPPRCMLRYCWGLVTDVHGEQTFWGDISSGRDGSGVHCLGGACAGASHGADHRPERGVGSDQGLDQSVICVAGRRRKRRSQSALTDGREHRGEVATASNGMTGVCCLSLRGSVSARQATGAGAVLLRHRNSRVSTGCFSPRTADDFKLEL